MPSQCQRANRLPFIGLPYFSKSITYYILIFKIKSANTRTVGDACVSAAASVGAVALQRCPQDTRTLPNANKTAVGAGILDRPPACKRDDVGIIPYISQYSMSRGRCPHRPNYCPHLMSNIYYLTSKFVEGFKKIGVCSGV